MDVNLPGINGLDATRQILSEPSNPVVVLLLSTYEEEEYAPASGRVWGGRVHPQGGVRTRQARGRLGRGQRLGRLALDRHASEDGRSSRPERT